jgi:hypothetical protein
MPLRKGPLKDLDEITLMDAADRLSIIHAEAYREMMSDPEWYLHDRASMTFRRLDLNDWRDEVSAIAWAVHQLGPWTRVHEASHLSLLDQRLFVRHIQASADPYAVIPKPAIPLPEQARAALKILHPSASPSLRDILESIAS